MNVEEVAAPLDPSSLQGEFARLGENLEGLDDAVERLNQRITSVLHDDDTARIEEKPDDSGPQVTLRVRWVADRIARTSSSPSPTEWICSAYTWWRMSALKADPS